MPGFHGCLTRRHVHFPLATMLAALGSLVIAPAGRATLVDLGVCNGAIDCIITNDPPSPITENPNQGILLAWDERQNFTLTSPLRVDRVFDPDADFVVRDAGGFSIVAGTVVSSHYLQWDQGLGSLNRVTTTITLDSLVFAFIISDQNLFDSDALVGLPNLDYSDFNARGLEDSDTTLFNGNSVDVSWGAVDPGDWTRLITAFSPSAPQDTLAIPSTFGLAGLGLVIVAVSGQFRRVARIH